MSSKLSRLIVALTGIAFCSVANAHPGHGGGLSDGILHPLFGFDHLLAMVAVGIWAFQLGGRAKWLVPVSFVTLMALAGALGMAGVALPMVDSGIATSLLVFGLLIAFSVRVTPALGACTVALFAIFHGNAHGMEMPVLGSTWQYGIGFILSTAGLHGLGLAIGKGFDKQSLWLRGAGALVALSSAWFIAA